MIIFLLTLIVAFLGIIATAVVYGYIKLRDYVVLDVSVQRDKYQEAVTTQKTQKPALRPVKSIRRGREVVKVEELKGLQDVPFEEGYAAIEELTQ